MHRSVQPWIISQRASIGRCGPPTLGSGVVRLEHHILRTDVSGMPLEWITYQDAVRLYYLDQVAYTCGRLLYRVRGGYNALSGRRSVIEVNSIVATAGAPRVPKSLKQQLAIGGRMVLPVGSMPERQILIRLRKIDENEFSEETLEAVRFVPLVGEEGWR